MTRPTIIARLAAAVQFLTLLPVSPRGFVPLSQAAFFFPLVGVLLALVCGSILLFLQPHLGTPVASLLSLTALILLTGGLHEDGLADIADACRAGRSRQTILGILKDSRIGTYGALALVASLLLRWLALSRCRLHPVLGLMAVLSLSRAAMVVLAGFSPAVGDGLGAAFNRGLSRQVVLGTGLFAICISVLAAPLTGVIMAGSSALITFAARSYYLRRIGGVNGDCLGATCQIVETVNLLILAWQPST